MGGPLPPDSGDSFEADLAAMRRDAGEWDAAAERMRQASGVAEGLRLGPYDLSFFGVQAGLVEGYRALQGWTAGLLNGSAKELASMANALRTAADNYETSDAAGERSFGQVERGLDERGD